MLKAFKGSHCQRDKAFFHLRPQLHANEQRNNSALINLGKVASLFSSSGELVCFLFFVPISFLAAKCFPTADER